jgi:hypothetical protein
LPARTRHALPVSIRRVDRAQCEHELLNMCVRAPRTGLPNVCSQIECTRMYATRNKSAALPCMIELTALRSYPVTVAALCTLSSRQRLRRPPNVRTKPVTRVSLATVSDHILTRGNRVSNWR